MADLPTGVEAAGGLMVGIMGALGAAAAYLKRRDDNAAAERAEAKVAHEAALAQQKAEHDARLAVLEAQRVQAEAAVGDIDAKIAEEVARLLPLAVAELQEQERQRVALERQEEEALVAKIQSVLENLQPRDEEA